MLEHGWNVTYREQLKYRLVSSRDFLLHDFALTRLEYLHHFANLGDNYRFNVIWHGRFAAALFSCWRLAERDVTFTPLVTCVKECHKTESL